MYHQISQRKLGRKTEHRMAMFKNMVSSLVDKEKIETTLCKAKELRPFADGLITLGKKQSLAAKRGAYQMLRSHTLVQKVFSDLAPRFKDRNGGFTRILKLGYRLGDAAPMAIIEYIPGTGPVVVPVSPTPKKKPKKVKQTAVKSAAPKEATAKKETTKKEIGKKEEPKKESKSWFRKTFFGK